MSDLSDSGGGFGRFAGGIAHDLNGMLQVIHGRATMLRMSDLGEKAADHVNELLEATQRAERLVQQVLASSRQQGRSPVRIALDDLVGRCAAAATRPLAGSTEVRVEAGAGDTEVLVDLAQMECVLVQLVAHAAHAMHGSGCLTIQTALVGWNDEMRRHQPFVPVGEYACITVTDTGTGIEPAMLPFIFEPFFTRADPSRLPGTRLAEAYGIVRQSGGYMLVDSEVGKGTRVRVMLRPVPGDGMHA